MSVYLVWVYNDTPRVFSSFKLAEEYLLGLIRTQTTSYFKRTITHVVPDTNIKYKTSYAGTISIDGDTKTIVLDRTGGIPQKLHHTETMKVNL